MAVPMSGLSTRSCISTARYAPVSSLALNSRVRVGRDGKARKTTANMTAPRQSAALLHRSLHAYLIWGANTDVGKTVFSTLLCGLTNKYRAHEDTAFLKPVSTGPPEEADDRCRRILLFRKQGLTDSCHKCLKEAVPGKQGRQS